MNNPHFRPSPEEMAVIKYDERLDQARSLADNTAAADMAMDFDTAFGYVSTMGNAMSLPLVTQEQENSTSNVEPTAFFRLAESLDIVMTYGDEDSRLTAAALAADLQATLPYASKMAHKSTILRQVLGIDATSLTAVPEQLARRYFEDGTPPESRVAIQGIIRHSRTFRT